MMKAGKKTSANCINRLCPHNIPGSTLIISKSVVEGESRLKARNVSVIFKK